MMEKKDKKKYDPSHRISVTDVAMSVAYCDIGQWIQRKHKIKTEPTLKMRIGSVIHKILDAIEKGLKVEPAGQLKNLNEYGLEDWPKRLFFEFLDVYKNDKSKRKPKFTEDEYVVLMQNVELLAQMYSPRFHSIHHNRYEYKPHLVCEGKHEFKRMYYDEEYTTVGVVDAVEQISDSDCTIEDHKNSDRPKGITEYMKVQLDGYAFLLKMCEGLNAKMASIHFPLYMIRYHYMPNADRFEVAVGRYIKMIRQDKPNGYFHRNACQWCDDRVKKVCMSYRKIR